jgi:hypothetical protein
VADYNGWKNRATWNVSLWVNNDESLYNSAVAYVRKRKAAGKKPSWSGFVQYAGLAGERTPDKFSYTGVNLDRKALSEMLNEILD